VLYRSWKSQFCLSVRPSDCSFVCPSVTRVLCDKTKVFTANIVTPNERAVCPSSFLTPTVVGGWRPLSPEIRDDWAFFASSCGWCPTHPPLRFENRQLPPISAHNVSTVRAREKCSIITNRNLITGFPTSYKWGTYVTPKTSKGWLKMRICRFLTKINYYRSNKLCYKVSLCEKWKPSVAEL